VKAHARMREDPVSHMLEKIKWQCLLLEVWEQYLGADRGALWSPCGACIKGSFSKIPLSIKGLNLSILLFI
jgi:hypothetical protein